MALTPWTCTPSVQRPTARVRHAGFRGLCVPNDLHRRDAIRHCSGQRVQADAGGEQVQGPTTMLGHAMNLDTTCGCCGEPSHGSAVDTAEAP
jgi:hypothetical protein